MTLLTALEVNLSIQFFLRLSDAMWPQAPTLNHIVSIASVGWPQTPKSTKPLLGVRIIQGLRGHFPGVRAKARLFFRQG